MRLSEYWRFKQCCQTGSTQEGSQRNMEEGVRCDYQHCYW